MDPVSRIAQELAEKLERIGRRRADGERAPRRGFQSGPGDSSARNTLAAAPDGVEAAPDVGPSKPGLITYSDPAYPPMKRTLIRSIELFTGQLRLIQIYRRIARDPEIHTNVWAVMVRHLKLKIDIHGAGLEALPESGPLVVVANHPYGILDGILICHITALRRKKFKILTNSALGGIPGVSHYFLPVDFSGSKEARKTNLQSCQSAIECLRQGEAVIIFPAGAVSTARTAFGMAEDFEWNPFVARMLQETRAKLAPVYFDGQNSRLFQIVSQFSESLRLSLLLGELHNKIGKNIRVFTGPPLDYETVAAYRDRRELMKYLRAHIYSLRNFQGQPSPEQIAATDAALEKAFQEAAERAQGESPDPSPVG